MHYITYHPTEETLKNNSFAIIPNNSCRTCRFGYGTESSPGNANTDGWKETDRDTISVDSNGIKRLHLKRRGSQQMMQISTVQLQSWRANCDIKLLLYDSDPRKANLSEITKVADYIVSYITKGNVGFTMEQKMMKSIIER